MGVLFLEGGPGSGTYVWSTWLFLRALGLIYFIAFSSYAVQVKGLIGAHGILPAKQYLVAQKTVLGRSRFLLLPSLCWCNASDAFLQFLCWGGALLSVAQLFGFAPIVVLPLLWLFYLSLFNVSRVFLGYQWDVLLLETGFLAMFAVPLSLTPGWPPDHEMPWTIRWLLWLLLFRLMFLSGYVKLRSGDPTWRNLTALAFHYETQPLPTRMAWHIHQLPMWFHKVSALAMYCIELILPFGIFIPVARPIAAWSFIAFMILIMVTGNYGFFNLATVALCLLLFDDSAYGHTFAAQIVSPQPISSPVGFALLILLLLLTTNLGFHLFGVQHRCLDTFGKFCNWFDRFRILNSYGLFSIMTPKRFEILVQGSDDDKEWRTFEFRYKPGDLCEPPRQVAPHQPRLDWQMWFAALSDYRHNPWFISFLLRLLEGRPEVLRLLEANPFVQGSPRFVRAVLCEYHFTDRKTRKQTGRWWRREKKWLYGPVLSLEGEQRQFMPAEDLED